MEIINKYKSIVPAKITNIFIEYYKDVGDIILASSRPIEDDMWYECRMEMLGNSLVKCKSIEEYITVVKLVKELGSGFNLSFASSSAIAQWCKTIDDIIKHFEIINNIIPFVKGIFELVDDFADILTMKLAIYFDHLFGKGDEKYLNHIIKFYLD